ncbi:MULTISPECIES: phosphopantetheine-binding protein [Spirosoma]|uniref:Acyl carrier protein n=1 Tax=Spirosoma sordidisoli TaxID=2502893 RepID=A0A4Q2UGJ6_9BACT|nr:MULTISPECIES: phosphopantetheine-binding protein [Spirosoma]RYC68457.1 acyl carrier protein [Spirosoma sordidisoli]
METLIETLKTQIIDQLNLDGVTPESIEADAPLFGSGLGLDSIDALELVSLVEQHYQLKVTPDEMKGAFESVRALAEFLVEHAPAAVAAVTEEAVA